MESNIGPWILDGADNAPLWQKGIQCEFDIKKNTADIRRFPKNKPIFDNGTLKIYPSYLESFPIIRFPRDCKKGHLYITVLLKRRPDMFPAMHPIITCKQTGINMPTIVFKKRCVLKTEMNGSNKRFQYVEEKFVAKISLSVLYGALKSFFEKQRRLDKNFFGSGKLQFEFSMRVDSNGKEPSKTISVCEHKITYILPSFRKQVRNLVSGKLDKNSPNG